MATGQTLLRTVILVTFYDNVVYVTFKIYQYSGDIIELIVAR
jgi:hypothetical protein